MHLRSQGASLNYSLIYSVTCLSIYLANVSQTPPYLASREMRAHAAVVVREKTRLMVIARLSAQCEAKLAAKITMFQVSGLVIRF